MILVVTPVSAADADWWDSAWPYRVRLVCEADEGDVAVVRLPLAGRTTPDGRDLRLVDGKGRLRPFEIVYHDPRLTTLIQFKVPPDKRLVTWLYFGKLDAPAIKTTNPLFDAFREEHEAWRRSTGEGNEAQPEPRMPAAWYPRRGVLLRVYRKAAEGHPESLRALRRLINRSPLEGAGFRHTISDGFNPFGDSDHYISVYEGYLRIDEPGEYAFCTVSDDGSWLRVNGQSVVEWPGAHDIGGAARGERHETIKLKQGTARVEYFHEEGVGGQMAFLGWRPPGQERFWVIEPEQWLPVRRAQAKALQARGRPLLAVPTARIVSTYWIRDTESKQATLVRFVDRGRSTAGKIIERRWDFGDGLSGAGREVEHVYFRLGRPAVTLTVSDDAGNCDSVSLAPHVFHTDYVARGRKYGKAEGYAEATADYDVTHLERDDLALYVEFCGNLELWGPHARAARAYLERFPDSPDVARVAADVADSYLQPQAYDPRAADEMLKRALAGATARRDRYNLLLRRAHVLGWHLDRPEEAAELYRQLQEAAGTRDGRYFKRLRRQCLIGLADAALMAAEYERAEALYREADGPTEEKAQPERLARIGSYAYTVEDLLARGEYTWAREALDKWEHEFPLQKLEGLSFFLRGKVLFVEQPCELALRYLDLAERVAPRAVHVPEAVWLRASCLQALGRQNEALLYYQRIATDFTYTEFLEKAAAKIRECEERAKDQ